MPPSSAGNGDRRRAVLRRTACSGACGFGGSLRSKGSWQPLGATIRLLLVACALLLTRSASAQEYNFRNISVAEGLAQSQVYAMCQDRRGAIWFGTRGGGLSCYDGVSFTAYTEEHGLANNYVRAIVEDRAGNLWIGTDLGLCRYDGRSITSVAGSEGLRHLPVNAIAEDSSGTLWFGSDQGGLVSYRNGRFTSVPEGDGLRSIAVRTLFVDRQGRLWIGTDRGVAVRDGAGFIFHSIAQGLPNAPVTGITEDREGIYWIVTYGGGVFRYDGSSFSRVATSTGSGSSTAHCILADHKGGVWIGTAGGGVYRYTDDVLRIFTETEGLCNNVVVSMMEDAEGNLWFGSSGGGVSRYDGERFLHFTERRGTLGNWIYAIYEDRQGRIWFGNSSGGVTRYDGMAYARFTRNQGFTSGKVKCIMQDSRGVLWFGTVGNGLFTYDGSTFHKFIWGEGVRASFINAVTEDRDGNLWVASSDAGVICIRSVHGDSAGRFLRFDRRNGLGTSRAYHLLASDDGTIWVATDGAGIARITPVGSGFQVSASYTAEQGLSSNTIRSVARGRDGMLLFGTGGGGIILFDGTAFRNIGKREGLRSNNIYSIVVDSHNQIWLGTEKGIARIMVDSAWRARELKHYGKGEGIRGIEISQNACCIDHHGNIWFGTIQGAVRYNPYEDLPNRIPPRTHITGIRLFSDPIESTPYRDTAARWYPVPASLALPYDRNHISFDFVGISHRNPDAVRYRWKLDGFDGEWSPPSDRGAAVYSNLPPGSYSFHVRSFNEDGVADSSLAGFHFTIDPPFWQTWWFRTAIVGIGAAVVGTAFHRRVAAIRRQSYRERRELEMRKNIVELEQKSLRLAMNPHFIFNALNSIQLFISDRDTQTARRYLSKFAKLMRLILENSRTDHVSIDDETAMLGAYLELERLNLNAKFRYDVDVDSGIDREQVLIPPMLVQPLVENAVVHGLRCKDGDGMIRVEIVLQGTLVCCAVIDDGIGRDKALSLRTMAQEKQASAALEVIRERLAIMKRQSGADARLVILDLKDAQGNPAGTRAEVYVPYAIG